MNEQEDNWERAKTFEFMSAGGCGFDGPLIYSCDTVDEELEKRLVELVVTREDGNERMVEIVRREKKKEEEYLKSYDLINKMCRKIRETEKKEDFSEFMLKITDQKEIKALKTPTVISLILNKILTENG